MFSRKKKQLQIPTSSQSHSRSPQEEQQSQPACPWSAHPPQSGQSPSPFLRKGHASSTSATTAGELFLFGGWVDNSGSLSNDLYVISTRDFSSKLLKTSGDVPDPRYGHRAVLTSSAFLIWGGGTNFGGQNTQDHQTTQDQKNDDSFYLLNLVSRVWTRVVVNGPGPGGRYNHTMTLVGSKLFVFGGRVAGTRLNDIWALDLNCLKSNPFWESYEPAPGSKKPLPRSSHVSVTTGDHIIIFGGCDDPHDFNDTWSFNISTRKWTELQCTGSIPLPRAAHAAVLIGDVMYLYGGSTYGGTRLGDLTALNLSTRRWIAFLDIGPGGRESHAMASDGRRVFVLGGTLSQDKAKLYVLDPTLLIYPKPNSNAVKHSETTELAQKLSAGHPTHIQSQHGVSSSSDVGATDGSLSTGHHAKFVVSGKEIARPEDGRHIELELERDRRIAQLTDELALKNALLEQAAEEKERAGLELRELQGKLDELLLSRDHALEQAQSAIQKPTSRIAEASERSQREIAELHAKLEARESELAAVRLRPADAENGYAKGKAEAGTDRNQNETSLINTDEDRVVNRLMERVQAMEAELASLRRNEKSFEMLECRNEG